MAFAKLSSSLLARNDGATLVSVPAAIAAQKSLTGPLTNVEGSECSHATSSQPLPIPAAPLGPISRESRTKLISFIVCFAAIGACGVSIGYYLEARRGTHAPYAAAVDKVPTIVEPTTKGSLLAVQTGIRRVIRSVVMSNKPPTATNAFVPGREVASPGPPAVKNNDEPPSAVTMPTPKRNGDLSIKSAALIERGDALFAVGDVASARLFYQYAAEAEDAVAALRLAEAFDPAFIARAHFIRMPGDEKKAMYWYIRASELGNNDAKILLKSLGYPQQ